MYLFFSFLLSDVLASDLWKFGFRELQCSSHLTNLAQGLPDVLLAPKGPLPWTNIVRHGRVGSDGHPDFHALMCFLLNLSTWPYIWRILFLLQVLWLPLPQQCMVSGGCIKLLVNLLPLTIRQRVAQRYNSFHSFNLLFLELYGYSSSSQFSVVVLLLNLTSLYMLTIESYCC